MENQISISKDELKRELETTIEAWVNKTFNFIQLAVLEKYTDNNLFEYIRYQSPQDVFEDWLNDCNEMEKVAEFFSENKLEDFESFQDRYEAIEDTMINSLVECFGIEKFEEFKDWCIDTYSEDINEFIYEQDNYPMWNTCFEFRDSFYNSEEDVQKCISVGLGVIEGLDDFNNLVFMTSCGHSFYSAYWIPLYFKLFPVQAEKYEGINYSDL
jgi:beta-galactosidase GanA